MKEGKGTVWELMEMLNRSHAFDGSPPLHQLLTNSGRFRTYKSIAYKKQCLVYRCGGSVGLSSFWQSPTSRLTI